MRDIKFRAWCETTSRAMEYFSLLDDDCPKFAQALFAIMQFTGLKDKNGKEIYESDILERTNCIGLKDKIVVSFGWHGERLSHEFDYGYNLAWAEEDFKTETLHDMEVAGNIYENPSMVEVV